MKCVFLLSYFFLLNFYTKQPWEAASHFWWPKNVPTLLGSLIIYKEPKLHKKILFHWRNKLIDLSQHYTAIWMNLKRHLQSSNSVWTFFDQLSIFWILLYVLFNILALFLYVIKTNHFSLRKTSPCANQNSFLLLKSPKHTPL